MCDDPEGPAMARSYFSHVDQDQSAAPDDLGMKQPAALRELARIHCQDGVAGGLLASPATCCAAAV